MAINNRVELFQFLYICSFILKISGAFWGGGNGGWGGQFGLGGFHSGYGHQGFGYGSGVCAGARQRQGIGAAFPQQPVSPYSYNNDFGHTGGYHNQDPVPIPQQTMPQHTNMVMPVQNGNLDYRINLPAARTTPVPATCSQPNARDPTVFDQKCIFPHENVQNSCSTRGDALPVGTTSLTNCKAPQYYSDTGDMMLEVCKDGKWHGDGKTLTCKSSAIVTQPPAITSPSRDPVVQYVQTPQVVGQPTVPINNDGANHLPEYNAENKQPYWTYNQLPSSQQVAIQSREPSNVVGPYDSPQYWSPTQNQTTTPQQAVYYPPITPPPSSTTTTTTEPTTTTTITPSTTTTTTRKPYQLIESIDWRQQHSSTDTPVQYPSNNFYYNPTNRNIAYDQNNNGKCTQLTSKAGMILECLSKKSNGVSGYILSINDCQEPQPVGTEATYKCQMYYEPLSGQPTQYRKCKENADWTGNDDGFGCKLECGKSNPAGRLPLITFGEMTILGQWPWHAALFIRDRGDDATNACGGTLISKKAVLTAAHCVNLYLSSMTRDLNDIRVDLGRYYRNKDDPYVQKLAVEKIVTHPAYNPFIFESDIAIIILKESARIGFHVRPICFPKSQNAAFDEIQLADGSYATVVGWGVDETGENPDELRSAKIQVIGYRECIESFEEADTGALLAKSTTFCAGNKNGTNVCRGDSGSGAYFAVKTSSGSTKWYLQGIVSLGINVSADDKKCDPEKVSIFTRVSPYADWINRVLSENDAI